MQVMIVDDEQLLRQGLISKIDWEPLGLQLAGEAEHGLEALAILEEQSPDIVLTDVRMPGMDGLQFIAEARRRQHRTKFVIVSGYGDFEYARAAMSHKVSDYLLKPVDKEKLNRLLSELCFELQQEREEEERLHYLERLDASVQRPQDAVMQQAQDEEVTCDDIVLSIRAYIDSHYAEDLSLQWVGETYPIHPNYFSKRFKQICGISFNEYISRKRIERSQEMLVSTGMKIAAISQLVGYEEPNYFCSVFKKFTGLNPTRYREQRG
ncbi:response regulator transcription factor [Paenibacillus silvisoli]|uniref:response regulator transcription factor n=1 Tax=Paenibacillus silvisoli TaxID=3110539 RepID=UPI002804FD94|nr:response regulator [Paenibacillus silvisoli]